MNANGSRSFRPSAKNRARLAFADKIGLNVSELVNEVLEKHLKEAIEDRARKIREAVSAPVP